MLPSSRPARTVKEDFSFSGLAKIELPNSIHDSLESEFRKSWLSFGEEPEPETRAASLTTVHQTSIQSLSEKIKDSTAAPFVTANNNSDPSFTERPNDSVVSFTALPAVLDVTKPESPMTGTSKNEDDIPLVEEEEEAQYLEGMKLAVVITGLLLTIFLVTQTPLAFCVILTAYQGRA